MKTIALHAATLVLLVTSTSFAQGEKDKPDAPVGGLIGAPVATGEAALRARLLAGFDANQDGELNARERQTAILGIRNRYALAAQGVRPVLTDAEVVGLFDADTNGQLNVEELGAACRALDAVLGEGAHRQVAGGQQQGNNQRGQQGGQRGQQGGQRGQQGEQRGQQGEQRGQQGEQRGEQDGQRGDQQRGQNGQRGFGGNGGFRGGAQGGGEQRGGNRQEGGDNQ